MQLSNTAEGGSNGVTVSTGNSGGASGNAWDAVGVGANTTVTYDTSTPAHGTVAVKVLASSGSAGGYVAWQSGSVGTVPVLWFRLNINVTSSPATDAPIVSFYGSGTLRARLWITSTRTLKWTDSAGTLIQTSTSALTASTYGRVEGFIIGDAAVGQVETNLYTTVDTLTVAQTQKSAASKNTGGTIDQVRFGNETGVVCTYFLDDLAVSDVGYLGAAGVTFTNLTPATSALVELDGLTARTVEDASVQVIPAITVGQMWPRGNQSTRG